MWGKLYVMPQYVARHCLEPRENDGDRKRGMWIWGTERRNRQGIREGKGMK
jgi:hypothetical protein